ncbi:MAG: TolC family protein [Sulfurospirillum sp.]|nr:TolC family protein [Sulfurospirillum sp.]
MKINKILSSLIITVSLLGANEKDLPALIEIALNNNIDIHVAKTNIEAKSAGVDYATSGYLPQVSLQGELAQYGIESNTLQGNSGVTTTTASIDQLLYDFGGISNNIRAANSAYDASLKQLDSTTNLVIRSVKRAYYLILNKNQLINVSREAVKIDELQLKQANEYFKAGVKTRIDVTNAKLQLSNSKLDLIKAEFELESANTSLITILGIKIEKSFSVKKDDFDISKLVNSIIPMKKSSNELIELGLANRAEVAFYKANIDYFQSEVKSIKSEFFPKILLNTSYSERNTDILSLDDRQASAGVYVKWDIFSGFSSEAKVKESLSKLTESKINLKGIELKITEEIIDGIIGVKKSEDSTKMQLLSVDLATQNLSLSQQRYKAGLGDMVELNDAKLEYTKSKANLVNTYYGYLDSVANLEYVIGKR